MGTKHVVPRAEGQGGIGTATLGWGELFITNTTNDSATQGGKLTLTSNDGAAMQSGSRLGVIEFKGAESSSALTIGARIEAICDAVWTTSENGASLKFYTTNDNATESLVLTLDSNKLAVFTGAVAITGNLTVNGTTTTVNSTIVTIDDPVFTLGGDTAPVSETTQDKGIEFRYHTGSAAKIGFFGWDDSASAFTFIADATNNSEVFSGSAGDVIFTNITGTLQTAAQTNITSVGALNGGTITSGFGAINNGASAITTTGLISGGSLDIDNVLINGTTIGHTDDTDLMTLADGVLTVAGELDAVSLDISGNADIDGTLEADVITVNGTALNTVIAGVTVTNATNSAHISVADNESTNEENLITFIENASATGNVGLESDGDFKYNPSTGTVSATIFKGNIDAVNGDFDGTLEADAITVNGTALNTVIAGVTVTNATNAGTLDSIDSSSFLRSDTADTMSGVLTMTNRLHIIGQNSIWLASNNTAKINIDARSTGDGAQLHKWNRNYQDTAYLTYYEQWYDGSSYHSIGVSGDRWKLSDGLDVSGTITGTTATFSGTLDVGTFTISGSGIIADAAMTLQVSGGSANALTLAASTGLATFNSSIILNNNEGIFWEATSGTNEGIASNGSNLLFYTQGANRLTISSNGQATFGSTTDYKIGLNDSGGTNQWWLKSYTNGSFAIHENTVGDQFNILAGGNVGIGTSSPDKQLTFIAKNDDAIQIRRYTTGQGAPAVGTGISWTWTSSGTDTQTWAAIRTIMPGNGNTHMTFSTKVGSDSTATEKMRVTDTGNVGIGTASPSAKLTIDNGSGAGGSLLKSSSSSYTAHFISNTSTGNAGIYVDAINGDFSGNDYGFIGQNNAGYMEYTINPSSPKPVHSFNQSVGIGTTSPTSTLHVVGTVNVTSTKNFYIDHPLESKKDTHSLIHASVESPEVNNLYRGKVDLVNGNATVNLDTVSSMTEGTFVALNNNAQCFTTNESDWDAVKGDVVGNELTISCQNSSSTANVSWMVITNRKDISIMEASGTDSNGKLIVEEVKVQDP